MLKFIDANRELNLETVFLICQVKIVFMYQVGYFYELVLLEMCISWFRKLSIDFRHILVFVLHRRGYSKTQKPGKFLVCKFTKMLTPLMLFGTFLSHSVRRNLTQLSNYYSKLAIKNQNRALKIVLLIFEVKLNWCTKLQFSNNCKC